MLQFQPVSDSARRNNNVADGNVNSFLPTAKRELGSHSPDGRVYRNALDFVFHFGQLPFFLSAAHTVPQFDQSDVAPSRLPSQNKHLNAVTHGGLMVTKVFHPTGCINQPHPALG